MKMSKVSDWDTNCWWQTNIQWLYLNIKTTFNYENDKVKLGTSSKLLLDFYDIPEKINIGHNEKLLSLNEKFDKMISKYLDGG